MKTVPSHPGGCIGILSVCPHLANVPIVSAIIEKLVEVGCEVRVFSPGVPEFGDLAGAGRVVHAGNPWQWSGYGLTRPLGHRGYLRAWALRERLRRKYRAMIVVDHAAVELAALWQPILRVPLLYCSLELLVEKDLPLTAQTLRRWHQAGCRHLPFYRRYIVPDIERAQCLAAEHRLALDKMLCIPNSWRKLPRVPKSGYLRRMLGLSGQDKIVVYAGNIGPGFGLEDILASVAAWPEPWKLVLHSSFGAQINPRISFELDLIRRLTPPGRVRVTQPDLPVGDYWTLLADADVGIAFYTRNGDDWGWLTNNRLMGHASGKINAYLRAGLPVITNDYTNLGDFLIRPAAAGFIVESAGQIASVLSRISPELPRLSEQAWRAYENYLDPEQGLAELVAEIDRLSD